MFLDPLTSSQSWSGFNMTSKGRCAVTTPRRSARRCRAVPRAARAPATARGRPIAADRTVHAGLAEIVDAGLLVDVPDALEALGGIALDLGSLAEAARLLGAAARPA